MIYSVCICLLRLQGKDSNTVNEGDSRRTAENRDKTSKEKVESTVPVLSAVPEELSRRDTVLNDPLSEQMNKDNGSEASVRIACKICIEIDQNVSCSDSQYTMYEFARARLVSERFQVLSSIFDLSSWIKKAGFAA